jgi:hypothetical protein
MVRLGGGRHGDFVFKPDASPSVRYRHGARAFVQIPIRRG